MCSLIKRMFVCIPECLALGGCIPTGKGRRALTGAGGQGCGRPGPAPRPPRRCHPEEPAEHRHLGARRAEEWAVPPTPRFYLFFRVKWN